jgi:preprotein translocase subunit SecY
MINEKKINLNRYKTVIQNVLITLFIILLFHTLSVITLPGIDLGNFTTGGGYSFTNMLNLLAGGGLTRMSMLAIGLGPYITAQIIMQLLSADLIPAFTRLSKQGERGKKVLEIYTRLLTLPFCMAQSYSIIALILQSSSTTSVTVLGYSDIGDIPFNELFTLMLIFTAGTYLSIFFADMITKRGIGNGVTLLILSGIIASFFSDFFVAFETIASKLDSSTKFKELTTILSCVLYVLIYIIVLMFVIFINNSVRKIPIQQLGHGLITNSEHLPFLPIKVNSAGVIPVIFATSIMTIPGTIAQFLSESSEIR